MGGLPGEKAFDLEFNPTSARGPRLCFGLLEETKVVKVGAGRLGEGRVRALWSWLSLAKASNKKALDSKETSPCSLSPAWDTSTPRQPTKPDPRGRRESSKTEDWSSPNPVKLTVSGDPALV